MYSQECPPSVPFGLVTRTFPPDAFLGAGFGQKFILGAGAGEILLCCSAINTGTEVIHISLRPAS